jgi:DNA-binding beta-propeller fold protein YncE
MKKFSAYTRTTALVLASLAGAATAGTARAADAYVGYHMIGVKILPGKTPRYDHVSVDPVNRHVFVGQRADGLAVFNIDTGELTTVADTKPTNGASIAPELGLGFADLASSSGVTVFDLKTLQVRGRVTVPHKTDGVFYDPATKTAYVNNAEEGSITLFDPLTLKAGETIALGAKKPEFSDVDGKGRAFVALQDKNAVAVVDMRTKKLAATWPIDCVQPTGLMYEPQSDRLFIPCRGSNPVMAVVDATSGKTVTTVPIGVNADAVGFNPTEKLVLVPNGNSATMSVFKQDSPDSYRLVETVATRLKARTLAVDTKTGKAFTVAPESTQPAAPPGGKLPEYRAVSDSLQLLILERSPIQ